MSHTAPSEHQLKRYANFNSAKADGIKVGDLVWAVARYNSGAESGKMVLHRVQGYSADLPNERTVLKPLEDVERTGGKYHGHFFRDFLKATEQSAEVDDLVRRALDAAKELGYCAETKNVIRKMGLTIPKETTTVTVEVTVESDDKVSEDAVVNALSAKCPSILGSKVTFKKA